MMPTLASLRNQFTKVYWVTVKILNPAVLFFSTSSFMPKIVAIKTTLTMGMWDTSCRSVNGLLSLMVNVTKYCPNVLRDVYQNAGRSRCIANA